MGLPTRNGLCVEGHRLPGGAWKLDVENFQPPGLNGPKGLLRMHWARRKQLLDNLSILVRSASPPKFAGKVRCDYVRYRTRGRPMDHDNLAASFKLVGDALRAERVIVDDDPAHLELNADQATGHTGFSLTLTPVPLNPWASPPRESA